MLHFISKFQRIFGLVLLIGLFYWMLKDWQWDNVSTLKKIFTPYTIFSLVTLCLSTWLIRGYRWKLLLDKFGYPTSFYKATLLCLTGNFFNVFLPAKTGDLIWINSAQQELNVPYLKGFISVLLTRLMDLWLLLFLGILTWNFFDQQPSHAELGLQMSIILLIGIGIVYLSIISEWPAKLLLGPLAKYQFLYAELNKTLKSFLYSFPQLISQSALSLIVWLFEAFMCYWIIIQAGQSISFGKVLFAIALGNASKAIPLTPGGMGAYESVVTLVISSSGLDHGLAVSVAIIDHLVKNLLLLTFGGVSALLVPANTYKVDLKKVKERLNEATTV